MTQPQATTGGYSGADTDGVLRIECELFFLDKFLALDPPGKLRKKRPVLPSWPVRLQIDIGNWGLVTLGRSLLDRDSLLEVYHEGDMVIVDEYDLTSGLEISQLRVYPGIVRAFYNLHLPGLTCNTIEETASVEMGFDVKLAKPKMFYSQIRSFVADPHDENTNDILKQKFCEMISAKLNETIDSNIDLWSHPDPRERSGNIRAGLESLLSKYGLDVSVIFTSRKLPPSLPDLVIEYRIAEQELLDQIQKSPTAPNPIGLNAAQITDIRTTSTRLGDGAGLFELSKDINIVDACLAWFEDLQPLPAAGICFLKLLKDGKISPRQLELTSKIVLSSFRNPMLGLGEWANPEKDVESAEIFQISSQMMASGVAGQGGGFSTGGAP
ncbi:MAG: hypothetical protein HS100_04475 [Anaerolineales bacterium]|nr:hypothetical protein [Anaerolineales bacterium]